MVGSLFLYREAKTMKNTPGVWGWKTPNGVIGVTTPILKNVYSSPLRSKLTRGSTGHPPLNVKATP
nr:MAG TPA: hypothetical protein [Microviridae sp.]